MPEGFPSLDFHAFHREELPRRLGRGWGRLAAVAASPLGGLAIRRKQGDAYCYLPENGDIRIVPGEDAADTVIELDHQSWEGLVHDVESAPGLLYPGRVTAVRGEMINFVHWEPALRAMFHGIPVYDPKQVDLRDSQGKALDPTLAFQLDDDREEMAEFMRTVGYVLVKKVFNADEIEALREGAEELRRRAVQGDKLSWWGRNDQGESVLCRVVHAGVLPVFRKLADDLRVAKIVSIADGEFARRDPDRPNGVAVLWKNPEMREGLSDLPWHRDCGMGGHAIMCPTMVMSIYLWPATPETGELRFLPGSWRKSCGFAEATDPSVPQGVAVPAEAGDVTLHYGDGMHAAPPPTGKTGPYRASVLMGFARPGSRPHTGDDHYNDALLQNEDGQVEHLGRIVERS